MGVLLPFRQKPYSRKAKETGYEVRERTNRKVAKKNHRESRLKQPLRGQETKNNTKDTREKIETTDKHRKNNKLNKIILDKRVKNENKNKNNNLKCIKN